MHPVQSTTVRQRCSSLRQYLYKHRPSSGPMSVRQTQHSAPANMTVNAHQYIPRYTRRLAWIRQAETAMRIASLELTLEFVAPRWCTVSRCPSCDSVHRRRMIQNGNVDQCQRNTTEVQDVPNDSSCRQTPVQRGSFWQSIQSCCIDWSCVTL